MASSARTFGQVALALTAIAVARPVADVIAQNAPAGFVIEQWAVPESCGEQSHFETMVSDAVGAWPEQTSVVRVHIAVTFERRRFALRMTTEAPSGQGERKLSARTCEELLATGAVVLSLALDSEALYRNERESVVVGSSELSTSPGTSASSQHGDAETPTLHRRDESDAPIQTSHDEPLDTSLRIVTMTESGTMPRTAVGVGLMAGAHSGPYRVSVRLMQWAEQVQFVGTTGDRGGSFDLLSGSLHVCRKWPGRRDWPHGLCVLGTVGRMSATGIAETPYSAVNLLASVGASAFYDLPFGLSLHAEGSGQLVLPRYTVNIFQDPDDDGRMETKVHQPAMWVARLGASWGLSF